MKKFLSILSASLLFVLLGTLVAPVVFATFEASEGLKTIESGQIVEDDLFIAAKSIVISGTVNGDVYAAANKTISVDGQINGDLYVVGEDVTISGVVTQDVIAATGTLTLQGAQIGDSVLTLSSNTQLDAASQVGGALLYLTGNLTMDSQLGRGLLGEATHLDMNGTVGRSALVIGRSQSLGSSAVVNGNFHYVSELDLVMEEGAVVAGEIKQVGQKMARGQFSFEDFFQSIHSGMFWISLLGYLVLGLLYVHFFPKHAKPVNQMLHDAPFKSLFFGFAALILLPIALMLLMFTIIGWPLAFVLGLAFTLLCTLARIFIGNFYGDTFAKLIQWKKPNPYGQFVLGLILYAALKEIGFMIHPTLGFFVGLFSFLFTFGAMILVLKTALLKHKK